MHAHAHRKHNEIQSLDWYKIARFCDAWLWRLPETYIIFKFSCTKHNSTSRIEVFKWGKRMKLNNMTHFSSIDCNCRHTKIPFSCFFQLCPSTRLLILPQNMFSNCYSWYHIQCKTYIVSPTLSAKQAVFRTVLQKYMVPSVNYATQCQRCFTSSYWLHMQMQREIHSARIEQWTIESTRWIAGYKSQRLQQAFSMYVFVCLRWLCNH